MINLLVKFRHSIFGRLLFIFLLIIIPLYFGGISIYTWGMNTVKKEITGSIIAQVRNYLSDLENDIKNIKVLQYEACVNDDDFDRLSVRSEALDVIKRTESINRFRNRLTAIKSSSKYIKAINAYIPAIDRVIHESSGIDAMPWDKYEMLRDSKANTISQLIYWQDSLYLTALYSQLNPTGINPRLIEIELSIDEIRNAITKIDSDSSRGALLVSPSIGLEIISGFDEDTGVKIKELLQQKMQKVRENTFDLKIENEPYIAVFASSEYLDMILCKLIPKGQLFDRLYSYQMVFWIFTAVAIIIIALFTLYSNRLIHQPMLKLMDYFNKVENGNLDISIKHHHNDEFQYLYQKFNVMVQKLNTLIHQVYKQKILAQKAELKHLQSQINPHFLYNSFFNLHNMVIEGDYESVELFTKQMGTYFQFVTRNAAEMVPLEKEISHARIYTDLQARRFRNRLKVEFQELPEGLGNIIVPRLIVQPVIENAFEHGLKNTVSGGLIRITFEEGPGSLKITVEDNGNEMTQEAIDRLNSLLESDQEDMESTGIINIDRRIRLKYGSGSGLKFSRSELSGLKAEIVIVYGGNGGNGNDVQDADS